MHITAKQLQEILQQRATATVLFGEKVENLEMQAEAGMRAVISLKPDEDGALEFSFDYRNFNAHNASCEKPIYYDSNRQPTLCLSQTKYYQPVETWVFDPDDIVSDYFVIVDQEGLDLFNEWVNDPATDKGQYITWLEKRVVKLQALVTTAPAI